RLATKRRPAGRRPGADSAQYRQPGDGRKRHPLQDLSAKTSRYCPAAEPRAQVSAASYRNFIAAHVGATADGPKTKNYKLNCWPTPRSHVRAPRSRDLPRSAESGPDSQLLATVTPQFIAPLRNLP